MLGLLALNELPVTDIVLFIVLGVIIIVAIAIYFLIPVFNKKQYQEQRDNLRKREIYFNSNRADLSANTQTAVEGDTASADGLDENTDGTAAAEPDPTKDDQGK